jgi:hypothetical protein
MAVSLDYKGELNKELTRSKQWTQGDRQRKPRSNIDVKMGPVWTSRRLHGVRNRCENLT